jgi:hypothetical protein
MSAQLTRGIFVGQGGLHQQFVQAGLPLQAAGHRIPADHLSPPDLPQVVQLGVQGRNVLIRHGRIDRGGLRRRGDGRVLGRRRR